nr:hypothetical protein [Tanacetum cinerariifolium]
MHGFSKNPVYVPGFLGCLMQDHQSDSANHKSKQVVGSLKHKKPSVFGEIKRLASKDEISESDDESSESDEEGSESNEDEETKPVENKNCKVMSESSRIYRGKEIMTDMKARFKVDISYFQAWRAKCYALKLLRWIPEESFAELPLYCHNLKVKNPWTITHIEPHDQDRFEIFFLQSVPRHLMRHFHQSSANQFAFSCFKTSVWRASYKEIIYDVRHPLEWEQPDGLIIVLPPLMDKHPPGRPRNRDRFRSKGEHIKEKSCTRCFRGGHNHRDCPSMVPS